MYNRQVLDQIRTDLGRGVMSTIARGCGISIQAVSDWFKRGKIPTERIIDVERIISENGSTITRHELHPSLFGPRPKNNAEANTTEQTRA